MDRSTPIYAPSSPGWRPAWRGLPAYVGCSGNFTVERILAAQGLADLHGNDVSLYSCALGVYLSGQLFRAAVKDADRTWLGDWLQPGLPTLAALLLCTTVLEFHGRDNPYHRRMWNAYLRRWPDLHAKTLANLEKGLAGVSLRSFFAGDVVDFLAGTPEESVVISFPPTYKGSYERLYKKLQAAFAWDEPAYQLFTPQRFATFTDKPVSMKYRGLFDLHSRKEGRLNYLGEAGKWSLEQALTWWQKTQQKQP